MISHRITSILLEENLILKEKSQEVEKHLYSRYAEDVLTFALSAHEKNYPASPDFKQIIKKWDMVNFTRKQVKGYTVEEPD